MSFNPRKFFHGLKVVKVNKNHECEVCSNKILKGSRALVEFGKSKHEGFYSCYFHAENSCYIDYLDAIQPSNTKEILTKVKDTSFIGEISYEQWREAKPFQKWQA